MRTCPPRIRWPAAAILQLAPGLYRAHGGHVYAPPGVDVYERGRGIDDGRDDTHSLGALMPSSPPAPAGDSGGNRCCDAHSHQPFRGTLGSVVLEKIRGVSPSARRQKARRSGCCSQRRRWHLRERRVAFSSGLKGASMEFNPRDESTQRQPAKESRKRLPTLAGKERLADCGSHSP